MKKQNKVKIFTDREFKDGNRLISRFMNEPGLLAYDDNWNLLMPVRYKIQAIGAHLSIDMYSELYWFYGASKRTRFEGGAGGCGPWSQPRKPFDSLGGKLHRRCVGVGPTRNNTCNVESEILATWDNIIYFIKWYNKTVLSKKQHKQ